MELRPLETPRAFELASQWLSAEENCRWLDFGAGVRSLSPASLKIMVQRGLHQLRLFTDDAAQPIGVVGLADIDREVGSASCWFVLGDKRRARLGYSTRAVAALLDLAFGELGLGAVRAWAAESNHASIQLLRRLGFRLVGRLRRSHRLDDQIVDRLWFDLLAEEHGAS